MERTSRSSDQNRDEEGRAEERHNDSDGQFIRCKYRSCEGITQGNKAPAEQRAKRQKVPCLGNPDPSDGMRHKKPDKG
jgi:hypothetical protein